MTMQRRNEPWNCQWCEAPDTGFTTRNDPATAALSDLSADMARHGLAFVSRAPRQPEARDTQPVLIVTTNEVPGYRITQVHGDVFGLIVRARNYFSNLGAQFRTLAGREVAGYTTLLTDSRNQARERMWREARARGANAVVAMRFDCNEIGCIMSRDSRLRHRRHRRDHPDSRQRLTPGNKPAPTGSIPSAAGE